MLLKSIRLKDFRSYLGEVNFELATDPNKNITVIHGENGVGKTAFLNAILWAFFNKLTPNFRNPKTLLNHEAQKQGVKTCYVEIEFEEDAQDYCVRRTYDQAIAKSSLKLFKIAENGTYGPEETNPEYFINTIIPPEMAEYFFFQGEGSSALEDRNKEGAIAKAIKNILGFRVPESLIKTLDNINRETRFSISAQDKTGEASKVNERIESIDVMLEDSGGKLAESYKQLEIASDGYKKADENLSKIANSELATLKKEEVELENKIKAAKAKRSFLEGKKKQVISTYAYSVFGSDFAQQSTDFIDESVSEGRLPEPYNEKFVKKILSEKTCVCGAKVDIGTEAHSHITSMLQKAANPVIQDRILGISAQMGRLKTLSDIAPEQIKDVIKNYDDNESALEKDTLALKITRDKIKEIPVEEIRSLQIQKTNFAEDRDRINKVIGNLESRVEALKQERLDLTSKLEGFSDQSKLIKTLKAKQKFVGEIQDALLAHLGKQEGAVRASVLTEVNNILEKFSRHDYRIRISQGDFKISLVDSDGNSVGQGDGLNLLLNLTITAALIKFAAARRHVNDPILSSATVAPLVIDAPFGVLDDAYRKVVVSNLPQYANQLVFIVSSSQWTADMDKAIHKQIGKEFCLVMEESSPQADKEIDIISIREKQYVLSKYDQPYRRTSLMEIDI
jgi:DNA sulfur modification protein DndD